MLRNITCLLTSLLLCVASLNAQIEYVLRDALRKAGRSKPPQITAITDPLDKPE